MFDILVRLFGDLDYKKYSIKDLEELRELLIQLNSRYENKIQGVRIIQKTKEKEKVK